MKAVVVEAWVDLRREWAKWVLAALVAGAVVYGTAGFEIGVSDRLDQFHRTVCVVIAASKESDRAQARFYQGAAQRAYARAQVDRGSLRQADLDAAAQDRNLAAQYERGERFQFPGC